MRSSALTYPQIANILGVEPVASPNTYRELRRWARAVRSDRRWDGDARAALGRAIRAMQTAQRSALREHVPLWEDPRVLATTASYLEAMAGCWRAEEAAGEFAAWLPVFMRADPFTEIEREIRGLHIDLEVVEEVERRQHARDLDQQRQAARAQLARSALTTEDYRKLGREEQATLAAPWLEDAAELRKFGGEFNPDLHALCRCKDPAIDEDGTCMVCGLHGL
jgi:hypothetical protein